MDQPELIIPQGLAQAILNYLIQQPYADVAGFIQALQQLRPKMEPIDMRAGQVD